MWKLEAATSFERAKKRYEKKRPDELVAVLRNLGRLRDRLDELPDCRAARPKKGSGRYSSGSDTKPEGSGRFLYQVM